MIYLSNACVRVMMYDFAMHVGVERQASSGDLFGRITKSKYPRLIHDHVVFIYERTFGSWILRDVIAVWVI